MKKQKKPLDYKQLEKELQNAIKADELYKLQNDAKLRAVEQNVPTYEHFRQMVNAAHLNPLDKRDTNQKTDIPWNTLISGYDPETQEGLLRVQKEEPAKDIDIHAIAIPKTYTDFSKTWELIDDDGMKFSYLWNCRTILVDKLFRAEIPPVLFHQLVRVCLEYMRSADSTIEVVNILTILSKCNRFGLTISFMSNTEKEVCKELFRMLLEKEKGLNIELPSIISLAAQYKVVLD